MRTAYRPATPEEEEKLLPRLARGELLLGVNDSQELYAIRQADGALRFFDFKTATPSLFRRLTDKLLAR